MVGDISFQRHRKSMLTHFLVSLLVVAVPAHALATILADEATLFRELVTPVGYYGVNLTPCSPPRNPPSGEGQVQLRVS